MQNILILKLNNTCFEQSWVLIGGAIQSPHLARNIDEDRTRAVQNWPNTNKKSSPLAAPWSPCALLRDRQPLAWPNPNPPCVYPRGTRWLGKFSFYCTNRLGNETWHNATNVIYWFDTADWAYLLFLISGPGRTSFYYVSVARRAVTVLDLPRLIIELSVLYFEIIHENIEVGWFHHECQTRDSSIEPENCVSCPTMICASYLRVEIFPTFPQVERLAGAE